MCQRVRIPWRWRCRNSDWRCQGRTERQYSCWPRRDSGEIVNGLKIAGISVEVPLIPSLPAVLRLLASPVPAKSVVASLCPRESGLHNHRGVDGPAFEDLPKAFLSGNIIGAGNREAVAHVESSAL